MNPPADVNRPEATDDHAAAVNEEFKLMQSGWDALETAYTDFMNAAAALKNIDTLARDFYTTTRNYEQAWRGLLDRTMIVGPELQTVPPPELQALTPAPGVGGPPSVPSLETVAITEFIEDRYWLAHFSIAMYPNDHERAAKDLSAWAYDNLPADTVYLILKMNWDRIDWQFVITWMLADSHK